MWLCIFDRANMTKPDTEELYSTAIAARSLVVDPDHRTPADHLAAPATTKRTHYQIVLQAIIDLADVHRAASRQQLVTLTGLKFTAVDDTIKRLKEDGKILSVVPGLFEPVPTTAPDRAISVTRMPTGQVKIELADGPDVELTSHEARTLGKLLAGMAQETAQVESYRMLAEQVARMQARISQMAEPHDRQRRRRTPH